MFLDSVEQLSHTESLYSSKVRIYEVFIFHRYSAYPKFKSSRKVEPCPCFITSAIDVVCTRTVIRENKT